MDVSKYSTSGLLVLMVLLIIVIKDAGAQVPHFTGLAIALMTGYMIGRNLLKYGRVFE
jgi:hypothetical protein